jgi:hypothetical protein
MDPKFHYSSSPDLNGVRTRGPRFREAATVSELYALWQSDLADAEKFAGRSLSAEELKTYAKRPDARLPHQIEFARKKLHDQLNAVPPDTRSDEQRAVDQLTEMVESERRSKLSIHERALLEAQEKLTAKIKADEAAASRAKIRETGGYRRLRDELDRAIFAARFDTSISVEMLEALHHQADLLEHRLDVATVKSNFSQLRSALLKNLEPDRLALRTAQDVLARREAALAAHAFDDVTPEVVGAIEYVAVTVGDRTMKVSKARFDSTPAEQLKAQLFPAESSNVQ